jgi:hypothetical protein
MSTSPKTFKQLETECTQLKEIIENLQGAVSQRQEEYEALCIEKAAAFFAERLGLKWWVTFSLLLASLQFTTK